MVIPTLLKAVFHYSILCFRMRGTLYSSLIGVDGTLSFSTWLDCSRVDQGRDSLRIVDLVDPGTRMAIVLGYDLVDFSNHSLNESTSGICREVRLLCLHQDQLAPFPFLNLDQEIASQFERRSMGGLAKS
jgi:hypothetical protein